MSNETRIDPKTGLPYRDPFDMTINPQTLQKSLIARRRGKPKYSQSCSKQIFDEIAKEGSTAASIDKFLLDPLNHDGPDVLLRRNRNGITPLIMASSYGKLDIMQMLLEIGADINDKDKHGRTPLIWAAREGHYQAMEKILQFRKGETLEEVNCKGQTAFDEALQQRQVKAMALLMFYGASITRDPRKYQIAWTVETQAQQMLLEAAGNRLDPTLLESVGRFCLSMLSSGV
jgi:ankyrin repeat protein